MAYISYLVNSPFSLNSSTPVSIRDSNLGLPEYVYKSKMLLLDQPVSLGGGGRVRGGVEVGGTCASYHCALKVLIPHSHSSLSNCVTPVTSRFLVSSLT